MLEHLPRVRFTLVPPEVEREGLNLAIEITHHNQCPVRDMHIAASLPVDYRAASPIRMGPRGCPEADGFDGVRWIDAVVLRLEFANTCRHRLSSVSSTTV
jgi:hypothetical protein